MLGATLFSSCDIERFPTYNMSDEQIKNDPAGNLDALLNGIYAQLKSWSDPMHRCGEYAGDNMVIRGSSTDAFFEFISYSRTPNNIVCRASGTLATRPSPRLLMLSKWCPKAKVQRWTSRLASAITCVA